jgi:hypothetical protein
VPGDRVQIDTCKVGKHLYQFTAIDDCTHMMIAPGCGSWLFSLHAVQSTRLIS